MTKDSGILGVPVPDDVSHPEGVSGVFFTEQGTIEQLTAFYVDYIPAHGWTLDEKHSLVTLAPGGQGGPGWTQLSYCKDSSSVDLFISTEHDQLQIQIHRPGTATCA